MLYRVFLFVHCCSRGQECWCRDLFSEMIIRCSGSVALCYFGVKEGEEKEKCYYKELEFSMHMRSGLLALEVFFVRGIPK